MSLSNASNFIINSATFVDRSIRYGGDALQLLSQHVAQGATHDSRDQYDNPKCHPDTRNRLLTDIKDWMLEPHKETGILYLYGPAGAGKSCIARSACEQARPPGFLLASFFFWRGSEHRNNTMYLVTTIAYQLAKLNSELAEHILAEIQHDPRIVYDSPVENQFRKLVLAPCRYVADKSGGQFNGVIIIDGLDECVDKDAQVSVVELLATMVNREKFPLGVFVTSRPELQLTEVWDTKDMEPVAQFISLSNMPFDTSQDIRTFLQSGFSRILNNRRFKVTLQSVGRPWPHSSNIETLVERSSGQFIYAATVLKFVSDRSRNPDAQLRIMLQLPVGNNASPLADLDSLYHGIMSRADDPTRTINVLSFILAVMDIKREDTLPQYDILADPLVQSINADINRQLLIVEQLMSLPRGEALLALNDLHSLIDLRGSTSGGHHQISFYHKSFRDFLLTASRSKEFYVDIQATHVNIVQSCVQLLRCPKYDTAEQHAGWLYSFFLWHRHIDKSGRREGIHNFEQLVQRFSGGAELHMSSVHLKDAFKLLGLRAKEDSLYEAAEVLIGFRQLSASAFARIKRFLWMTQDGISDNESARLRESLICFPLLVSHLKSYKMNLVIVKRSLALHAIIPFLKLCKSGLYSTGIIHELESRPEIKDDMIYSDLFDPYPYITSFPAFLSTPRFSEIFSCTPEDFADAYCDIINISTSVSPDVQEDQIDQYSILLQTWTSTLHEINPAVTSAFLTALKSAARDTHDQARLNRSLTCAAKIKLLEWLENLPSPPQDIIDAWRRSFNKARCAAGKDKSGYYRYYHDWYQQSSGSSSEYL